MARTVRCKRCQRGVPHAVAHGTRNAAEYHGCDCAVCIDVQRQRGRARYGDGARARSRRHYHKNRDTCQERHRQWYQENSAQERANQRAYYERNRDTILEAAAVYRDANRQDLRTKNNKRYWQNVEDNRRQARKNAKRRRGATRPVRTGYYSATEDKVVMREDISLLEMATMLGRSIDSVGNRRQRLHAGGLSGNAEAFALNQQMISVSVAAERLGVCEGTIFHAIRRHILRASKVYDPRGPATGIWAIEASDYVAYKEWRMRHGRRGLVSRSG